MNSDFKELLEALNEAEVDSESCRNRTANIVLLWLGRVFSPRKPVDPSVGKTQGALRRVPHPALAPVTKTSVGRELYGLSVTLFM